MEAVEGHGNSWKGSLKRLSGYFSEVWGGNRYNSQGSLGNLPPNLVLAEKPGNLHHPCVWSEPHDPLRMIAPNINKSATDSTTHP